jgi:outer membrane protein assembly factor BamB
MIIAGLGGLPAASAQAPRKRTYAFLGLIPDKVGVGQETLVHIGIATATASVLYGWEGLTVTVTRPDGTTQTLGPFKTDSTGGTGTAYVPTQVGTYSLQSHFPEQANPAGFFEFERGTFLAEGTIMEASNSEVVTLEVTEEPQPLYPAVPLPTEFWSRPADAQFREWSSIAGNWVEIPKNRFAPDNDGPETAHILWTEPYTTGGLAGGFTGEHQDTDGDAYEGMFQNSVIINGILFYRRFGHNFAGPMMVQEGIVAVDLRTGEELWFRNNTRLDFGQTFYFDGFNHHGVFDYLWEQLGSTWNAYDPFTGEWMWTMTDVPSGARYTGPNGEFYILVTDMTNGWMALWNQTACGQQNLFFPGDLGSWGRFVHSYTFNASTPRCYSWNVTIPTDLPPANVGSFGAALNVIEDKLVGISMLPDRSKLTVWAISLKPGQEGQVLFNRDWTPPTEVQEGVHTIFYVGSTNNADGGVICVYSKELRRFYGFSLDTGAYLWETESEHYLSIYGFGNFEHDWWFAYNKLYTAGTAGIVYCYDLTTGETLWTYEMGNQYGEYLFGNNFWGRIPFITDGKIYVGSTEHSSIDPKPRGAPFVCLDAETGEEIWRTEGMFRQTHWGGRAIIGDSIMATQDTYDQRIYAVGKGPSAVTIEAEPKVSVEGGSVVIEGMVTDISAGTKDPAITARFPNGVAAVSDESMSNWMEYVYKQFPRPTDTVGVSVVIDVVDANGNYRNIGTAISDTNGFYSLHWTPDIPGKYTVLAHFEGTSAYYPSVAETAFAVDEAPQETPPPPPTPVPPTDTYILGMGAAAIIAIVVMGLLIILILRKR